MKIPPPDAFIMNLKMVSNDIYQMLGRLERAYNSADDREDYMLAERLKNELLQIRNDIQNRLDKA